MRKPLLFIFIFISNFLLSQNLNLDNNLTAIVSNSTNSQIGLSFNGENSFTKNKWQIVSITNYSLSFSTNISENELVQRFSYDWRKKNWFRFTTYQFNYSYIRQINSDHWIGIGTGYKKQFKSFTSSISYALVYQNSNFQNQEPKFIFRNSIRLKFEINKKKFSISSEYYYQPGFIDFKNLIFYGTTKINLFPENKITFAIQDVINYRNESSVKMIHNLTLGIGYKFNKNMNKKD